MKDVVIKILRVGYWGGAASGEVPSVWGYFPRAPIMKTNVTVTRNAIPIAMIQFSGSDKCVRSRKIFTEISAVTMPMTEVMGTSLFMDTLFVWCWKTDDAFRYPGDMPGEGLPFSGGVNQH